MKRRTFLENSLMASASLSLLPQNTSAQESTSASQPTLLNQPFTSTWDILPDRTWIGENMWANRLQDWHLVKGGLECNVRGRNRSVALLTHALGPQKESFSVSADIRFLNRGEPSDTLGIRLGSTGPIDDYRSAAIYGKGMLLGVQADGKWVVGEKIIDSALPAEALSQALTFEVSGEPLGSDRYRLILRVRDGEKTLAETTVEQVPATDVVGGLALVSHANTKEQQEFTPSARFENWQVGGAKVVFNPEQTYGPLYFAQYTLHNGTVKLSALCAPLHEADREVILELKQDGEWKRTTKRPIDPVSLIASFRLVDWKETEAVPYRLTLVIRPNAGRAAIPYFYEGSISPEPAFDQPIKLGLFSCNTDHGFPDTDLRKNILHHKIDAALFLGDQFYESSGGFGVEATTLDRSILDYMRKWQQFGWSFRDVRSARTLHHHPRRP